MATSERNKNEMCKATLVEQMKTQTLGVEIEMNHISRSKAAALAASYFGTGRYENTQRRNGYYTWSAWDAQNREWKFQRDSSISGPDDEKCELVTPILHYGDIELLQGLVRELRHAGAVSNPNVGCGVHIHVGADGHNARSVRNLMNIMSRNESLLIKSINIDYYRTRQYCRTVDPNFKQQMNTLKPKTMAEVADIWYGSQNANYDRRAHYNPSRYHMLNLHALFTKGTIEFRLFQFDNPENGRKGGLHAGQLKAYIQLALAINQYSKMVSRTVSKEPAMNWETPAYAMRQFLHRMGLHGDEFKTLRELSQKRLEGNTRWRFGGPQEENN